MKLNVNLNFDFKYHRSQQIWILLLAIIPGALAFLRYISGTAAGLLVLLCYYVSKRHMKETQRQWESQERAQRQEAERLAALPARVRKNLEKRKLKEQQQQLLGQEEDQVVEAGTSSSASGSGSTQENPDRVKKDM